MRDPWSAIVAELFRQIQTFSRGDADRAPTYKGDPTGFEEPTGGHRECRSAESPNAATSMEGEDDRLESYSVPALPRRRAHDRLALRCVRLSRPGRLRRRERWHRARPTDARRGNDYAGFASPDRSSQGQSTPAALGGTTQSPYLVVADADSIYHSAVATGAEIVIEIKDEDYGGRGFCCRDPEGHLWNVGTYDPWKK